MPHHSGNGVNLPEYFLRNLRGVRLAVHGAGRRALRRLAEQHRPGLEVEEQAEPPEALH